MDGAIVGRLCGVMERHGLDAVVGYSKENVRYCGGYTVQSQEMGVHNRQFAVAVNRDGQSAMLLTANEMQEAKVRSSIKDLHPYDEFADDPMAVLAGALRGLGVAEGRVGLEMDAIPADRWEDLKKALPRTKWIAGGEAFQEARMVKTPAELNHLRKAAQIAEEAQAEAHKMVRVGVTEQDVYRAIVDNALARGAERVLMVQVAAGERSSYSNPVPSQEQLRRGDMVKIDVFVSSAGYLSDTGRAFAVGEAKPEYKEAWACMQETLANVHATIHAGGNTSDLWNAFTKGFAKYRMEPAIRFLGHGLGLSLHEEPFIAAHTNVELEADMVFAIEPVYRIGNVGFHLEDNLIVTEHGVENMTSHFDPELIVLG